MRTPKLICAALLWLAAVANLPAATLLNDVKLSGEVTANGVFGTWTGTLDLSGMTLTLPANVTQLGATIDLSGNEVTGALPWGSISSKPTTLAGYGITNGQPLDSDLTALAAVATTVHGRSLLDDANAAASRATIGAAESGKNGSITELTGLKRPSDTSVRLAEVYDDFERADSSDLGSTPVGNKTWQGGGNPLTVTAAIQDGSYVMVTPSGEAGAIYKHIISDTPIANMGATVRWTEGAGPYRSNCVFIIGSANGFGDPAHPYYHIIFGRAGWLVQRGVVGDYENGTLEDGSAAYTFDYNTLLPTGVDHVFHVSLFGQKLIFSSPFGAWEIDVPNPNAGTETYAFWEIITGEEEGRADMPEYREIWLNAPHDAVLGKTVQPRSFTLDAVSRGLFPGDYRVQEELAVKSLFFRDGAGWRYDDYFSSLRLRGPNGAMYLNADGGSVTLWSPGGNFGHSQAGQFSVVHSAQYYSGGAKVVDGRRTGWTAPTGTAERTGYATYTAPDIAASYTEAEVQALADQVQALSRTLKALIDDLHSTAGHGLIGP